MTQTHTLKLADGYGEAQCELINTDGPLSVVRINSASYWEQPHYSSRVVLTSNLRPIEEGAA